MAALTSAAVTPYPTGDITLSEWPDSKGNRSVYNLRRKVVLTGQGTAANPIGPDAFGFVKFLGTTDLYDKAAVKTVPAVVDPTTNTILLCGGASGVPADVTSADSYITVKGVIKP